MTVRVEMPDSSPFLLLELFAIWELTSNVDPAGSAREMDVFVFIGRNLQDHESTDYFGKIRKVSSVTV